MFAAFLSSSLLALASSTVMLAAGPLGTRGLIGTLIIGFIVGALAKFVTPMISPGREPRGCIVTIVIGVVGSYLALFLGHALHIYQDQEVPGFIGSLIGAILLLVIYHVIMSRSSGTGL